MFRAGSPVTATEFHDRRTELGLVRRALGASETSAPRWLAILGVRKVGKTSLLLEAARELPANTGLALLDASERTPPTLELFRTLTLRAVDVCLAEDAGGSLARRAHDPASFRALIRSSALASTLPSELRADLDELPECAADEGAVHRWLQLPQDLVAALGRRLVVAIDEIQELADVRAKFELFPMMRSVWQHHDRVSYVVSGSAPSMLRELVTSEHSPFFQHFEILELGPFARADAVSLLIEGSPRGRRIPRALAERVVDVVGGHPFYLQLVGEALVSSEPPYDEEALKPVMQSLVFSRTGRLGLYFENQYNRIVGRASTASATLQAIAELGPARLTDVASAIGSPTASTARYVERLGECVVRDEDRRYSLVDPVFAAWVRWRSPGGSVVPMRVLGDEAELAVAENLAGLGFDLVYRSRASRGAFDLLALRGADQLGVQVKRSPLPLRFGKREWNRMEADAERLGWRWAIAAVDPEGRVTMLDPAGARRGRELRLDGEAAIENVLAWIDRRT